MVVAEMGKPLAPKSILFVSDLPKTRNAKSDATNDSLGVSGSGTW